MSTQVKVESNRRQEPRYRGRCRRVTWRGAGDEPSRGVLCDYSASGASFLISHRDESPLELGEQIVLRLAAPGAETQIYQVRRLERVGFGHLLAGCCRAEEAAVPIDDEFPRPRLWVSADTSQMCWVHSHWRNALNGFPLAGFPLGEVSDPSLDRPAA